VKNAATARGYNVSGDGFDIGGVTFQLSA
jgi:hypothetical protein